MSYTQASVLSITYHAGYVSLKYDRKGHWAQSYQELYPCNQSKLVPFKLQTWPTLVSYTQATLRNHLIGYVSLKYDMMDL